MRAFMGLPCPNKIAGSVADIHESIQYVSPKISRLYGNCQVLRGQRNGDLNPRGTEEAAVTTTLTSGFG